MALHSIIAANLGKRFFLGENTTRDRFRRALHAARLSRTAPTVENIWAIRNVSFEVEQGEAIGIIGHNGAGKSTLLKVLSRVTGPTEGHAMVRGRLATLLEVGTGFHPELTGRDNIFLSGAILGMPRAEIARKFDDIVSFSEVERFIDTPVKRYSSGMYVRLAFAVAAHLEPDVLVIDEVLAVGDSAFQRKSLGRLNDTVQEHGRTVLFVSHNLQAIRSFCRRVLLLDKGRLVFDGPAQEGIERYLKSVQNNVDLRDANLQDRLNRTSGAVRFTEAVCIDASGKVGWQVRSGDTVRLQFSFEALYDVSSLVIGITLRLASNMEIISTMRKIISETPIRKGTKGRAEFRFPDLSLRPNEISLYGWMAPADGKMAYDVIDENVDLPFLKVTPGLPHIGDPAGLVNLRHEITIVDIGREDVALTS